MERPENGEYIINWLFQFTFFGHIFYSLSFFKPRNMNTNAYLGPYCFIFLCFFSYVTVEGVKSRKLGFIDLAPSTVIIENNHKNII